MPGALAVNLSNLAYRMPGSVPGGKTKKSIQGSETPLDHTAKTKLCVPRGRVRATAQWHAVCLRRNARNVTGAG